MRQFPPPLVVLLQIRNTTNIILDIFFAMNWVVIFEYVAQGITTP